MALHINTIVLKQGQKIQMNKNVVRHLIYEKTVINNWNVTSSTRGTRRVHDIGYNMCGSEPLPLDFRYWCYNRRVILHPDVHTSIVEWSSVILNKHISIQHTHAFAISAAKKKLFHANFHLLIIVVQERLFLSLSKPMFASLLLMLLMLPPLLHSSTPHPQSVYL